MSDEKLAPGNAYVVTEIQQDHHAVVEGYRQPADGIYWTEFEPAP